jgi:hypothetical protein
VSDAETGGGMIENRFVPRRAVILGELQDLAPRKSSGTPLERVVWDMVTILLKKRDWIRQRLEEQANDPSWTERVIQ